MCLSKKVNSKNDQSQPSTTKSCGTENLEQQPTVCSKGRNYINLPTLAEINDKYHISDTLAAAAASTVVKDIDVIIEIKISVAIDKNKIRRALQRKLKSFCECFEIQEHVSELCFDGRTG